MLDEALQTDVLVIGGGLAGLMAALEARRCGCDVLLVSKKKVGRSGNTVVSAAGMSVLIPGAVADDSREAFSRDILRGGAYINDRKMVETFVEQSGEMFARAQEYGVKILKGEDGIVVRHAPGHSKPRFYQTDLAGYNFSLRGLSLGLPLRKALEGLGVRILEGVTVARLLRRDGRVTGAVGIAPSGQRVALGAKAVILCTGGGGRVYSRTNNTADIAGDSYGLAVEAGAALKDMEFVQFYPTMMFRPAKLAVMTPLFGDGAVLRNNGGEAFMAKYDPENADMATRDVMARAIFAELEAGRGVEGGVYFDCRGVPERVLKDRYPSFCLFLAKLGKDPQRECLIVTPVAHFFMGGITIGPQGRTRLPGLWAAGEAAAGLHGANRLAGNALTEALVFGGLAGLNAALESQKGDVPPVPTREELELAPGGDLNWRELAATLGKTMWQKASLVRSEEGLEEAAQVIERIEDHISLVKRSGPSEIIGYFQLKNSLQTAKTIVAGALHRRESRGSHFRSDYQEAEPSYKGNIEQRLVGQKEEVDFIPLDD